MLLREPPLDHGKPLGLVALLFPDHDALLHLARDREHRALHDQLPEHGQCLAGEGVLASVTVLIGPYRRGRDLPSAPMDLRSATAAQPSLAPGPAG